MGEVFPPDDPEGDAEFAGDIAAVEAAGTMADVHERHGSRPVTPDEFEEFEEQFGPFLPPDGEG